MADSANPFDDFDPTGLGSGMKPPTIKQEEANPFAGFGEPNEEQPSTAGAFTRGAVRGAAPAAGGLAGAGAGVEAGAAIGALTSPITGPIGPLVGGFIGGVAGGFGGSYLADKGQEYALSKAPDSWVEALGQSDRQQRLDQETHPYASFLGGLAPFALTMSPFGDLKNATAMQRLMANPVTARVFSGAMMGGIELGQEATEGQVDWNKVAISTVVGMVLNRPNGFGEAIEGSGPALARRLGVSRETPRPAPTLNDANAAGVAGPGATEATFQGSQERDPVAHATAQENQRNEMLLLAPPSEANRPNPNLLARQSHPELHAAYEDLQSQADTFRRWAEDEPENEFPRNMLSKIEDEIADLGDQVGAAKRRAAEAINAPMVEPAPIETPKIAKDDRDFIVDDVKRQFMAAGRPEGEAEGLGRLVADRFAKIAQNFPKDGTAAEIYRREGAEIRGEDGKVKKVGGKVKSGPEVVASNEPAPPLPDLPHEAEAEALRRAAAPEPEPVSDVLASQPAHAFPAEDTGERPPVGPTTVYRIGSANGGLSGKNAGNLRALATHLVNQADIEAPQSKAGEGNVLTAYSVELPHGLGEYEHSNAGSGVKADAVGRRAARHNDGVYSNSYSFPKGFEGTKLFSITRDDINAKLKELGFADADDAGIYKTEEALRDLIQQAKQQGPEPTPEPVRIHPEQAEEAPRQLALPAPEKLLALPKPQEGLRELVARGAPKAEILAHPAFKEAEAKMDAITPTDKRWGPGDEPSEEWKATREFNFDGEKVIGYDEAIPRLEKIAEGYSTDGPVRADRQAFIIIGPPASGKSTIAERLARNSHSAIVDSDDVKPRLPEYAGGIGASAVHEESAELSAEVLANQLEKGHNVIIPKVGDKTPRIEKFVDLVKARGYDVHIVNMQIADAEALRRMIGRFLSTGRLINPHYFESIDGKPTRTYEALKNDPRISSHAEIDANGPRENQPVTGEGLAADALREQGWTGGPRTGENPETPGPEVGDGTVGGSEPAGATLGGAAPEVSGGNPPEGAGGAKAITQAPESPLFGGDEGERTVQHGNVAQTRSDEGAPPPGTDQAVTRPPRSDAGDSAGSGDISAAAAARLEARKRIEERSRSNYRITDEDKIGEGGPKAKVRANIEAIKLLKQLENESREATPEEKAVLVKYTGWGAFSEKMFNPDRHDEFKAERKAFRALVEDKEYEEARRSTLNAHYTSPDVIKGMWDALTAFGYKGGEAIEPSAGVGHFIGLIPDSVAPRTSWTAVELDGLTARIAKALYGGAEVNHQGFETLNRPSNYYDLAISNVPFGDFNLREKGYGAHLIHDFFFIKSLDKVRPGGVVSFITSKGTMDKGDRAVRERLAKDADLVGAIRLPGGKGGAFSGNAGTEVTTDIIFLRKKIPGEPPFSDAKWMDTKEIETPDGPTSINEYFVDNPSMMLGEMRLTGSMYGKNEPVLVGETEGLREKIAEAAGKMPAGAFTTRAPRATTPPVPSYELGQGKEGAFVLKDGVVYRREGGTGVPQKFSAETIDKISKLIGIRDIYNDLLTTQLNGLDGAEHLREKLRAAYKEFVDKHGPINKEVRTQTKRLDEDGQPIVRVSKPNFDEFRDDPDSYKVASIEDYNPETDVAKPTAIQTKDVIDAPTERQINSPADALASVLDSDGVVDLNKIGQAMGAKTEDEVIARLGDLVYQNPNGRKWEPTDNYLSGNVITKLEEARAIAKTNPEFQRNVDALEKVQPEPLTAVDITAQLGAPWVPGHTYVEFLKELGAVNPTAELLPMNKEWRIDAERFKPAAEIKYGIGREDVPVKAIIKAALNNRQLKVWDRVSEDKRVINQAKTEEAAAKIDEIRTMFSGDPDKGVEPWAFSDPDRAKELEAIYNRTMNDLVPWRADGAHLTLPGLNPMFADRSYRKDVVWRIIQKGNTLLAHAVGAGKTVTMAVAAMEQKRLGLIKKPAFAVPNHMLDQFSSEFIQAYPNANILVANKDEMSADYRRQFVAKTASGDWDAIIFTHSSFGRLGVSSETQIGFLNEQLREHREALQEAIEKDREANTGRGKPKKSPTVKQLESQLLKYQTKLEKLLEGGNEKDKGTTFEETGIDHVIVDEAHLFKNLAFASRYESVRGLNFAASQRAEDLFMKIRYLEQRKPGRSAIFATGTPMSNTMAELWTMMRYLELDKLKERGLDKFDAWANTFGKTVTQPEMAPDGRSIKDVTSFSRFVNIPELVSLYSEIADSKTAEQLQLQRPSVVTREGKPGIEVVKAELSEQEENYVNAIVQRMEAIKGTKREKGEDNTISLMTEGKKVATDGRLLGGGLGVPGWDYSKPFEFNPKGKIAKLVTNVKDIYDRYDKDPNARSQMIFLDSGTPKAKEAPKSYTEKDLPEGFELTKPGHDGQEGYVVFEPSGSAVGKGATAEEAIKNFKVWAGEEEHERMNLYEDIRDRLVAEGIPKKEIAFMHDADTDEKKRRLFAQVNAGTVRVLIGSTQKMGVGTNAQKRLIAMHHMDPTDKPAEIEQRDGRIVRQGNLNKEVHILRYITERSLDATRWQILERKAKFIGQVNSGTKGVRVAEDIDNPLPEAEMMKAAASGDPRIMELAELTRQVRQLTAQKRGFDLSKQRAGWEMKSVQSRIAEIERYLAGKQGDVARVQDLRGDKFKITLGDKEYTNRKEAGQAILDRLLQFDPRSLAYNGKDLKIGQFSGFDIYMFVKGEASFDEGKYTHVLTAQSELRGDNPYGEGRSYVINEATDPVGLIGRFGYTLSQIKPNVEYNEQQLAEQRKSLDVLSKTANGTWAREAEYRETLDRQKRLTDDLRPKKPEEAKAEEPEAETELAQERELEQASPVLKQGRIRIRRGLKSIITILKFADASTGVHELAHDWLEQMRRYATREDAPAALKADWETTKREHGITDDGKIPTKAHEQFANGYMKWLSEGTAPTHALAKLFEEFRDWMVSLFDAVKSKDIKLSDAMRGVYERLHTTEERPTVIAPHETGQPSLAVIHETDAAETPVIHAGPAADRIAVERTQAANEPPGAIADEIASHVESHEAEQAAAGSGGNAAGEAGPSVSGPPEVDGNRIEAGPVASGGGVGAQPSAERAGGDNAAPKSPAATGGSTPGRSEPVGAARNTPLAPRPIEPLGGGETRFVDKAGNFKRANINSTDDMWQAIKDRSAANSDFIGDRRGVVTNAQVQDLANKMGQAGAESIIQNRVTGMALNAEQIVALTKLLEDQAYEVARLAKVTDDTPESVLAYATEEARLDLILKNVMGATAEAGRALGIFRAMQGKLKNVDEIIRAATGRTLWQATAQKKLMTAYASPEQVSAYVSASSKASFGRMLLEYWVNGLISGTATHTTYMIGNTLLSIEKGFIETPVAAAIGALRNRGEGANVIRFGEAAARARGFRQGLAPAVEAAGNAFRLGTTGRLTGLDPVRALAYQDQTAPRIPGMMLNEAATWSDAKAAWFGGARGILDGMVGIGKILDASPAGEKAFGLLYSPLGAFPDIRIRGGVLPTGQLARLPSRAIATIHTFFRAVNFSMEKNALAYRQAAMEGLKDEALWRRVGDLRQNPDEEMMRQAARGATDLTLMGPGGEFTQRLSRFMNSSFNVPGLGETQLLKFIDPFVHISANIIDQTLVQRTPLGVFSPQIRADLMGKHGVAAQDMAQARMLTGTIMALGFGALAGQGYVSGSGPADPNKRAVWLMAGNQPHSVRIGDTWYQMNRLGPLGMLLGMSADLYDVSHAASKGDMAHAAALLQHAITQNVLDESFMRGPADLIQAVEDPARHGERYIQNFASSFLPYSVGMAQMNRAMDPYQRQTRSVLDAIKAKVPGQSETLLPRRDIWGNPLPNHDALFAAGVTAIYETEMSRDPVNMALAQMGIGIAPVQRTIRNVKLDDQQYDDFARLAGKMAKQRLDVIVRSPDWRNWPPGVRADAVAEVVRGSREAARGMMFMKYPSILSQATSQTQAKREGAAFGNE